MLFYIYPIVLYESAFLHSSRWSFHCELLSSSSHEKLQEAGEKMEIETAVKKMGYENKIKELEDTVSI